MTASISETTDKRVLFTGGKVFDGTGSDPEDADVVVQHGVIVDVGTGLDGDEAVELNGGTVLPGFFDCHVHLTSSGVDLMKRLTTPFSYQFYEAMANLRATLQTGVTTVRDAGGSDLGIKQALADGLIEGPRVLLSINIIGQTGGHTDGWFASGNDVPLSQPHPGRPPGIADGPAGMRQVVRRMFRAGADQIKICTTGGVLSPRDDPRHTQFTPEEIQVAVAEARAHDSYVLAHAQGTNGIKNAVRAGVRSIEHGIYLDSEAISMMLERGTWLVPTLAAPRAVLTAADAGVNIPTVVVEKARAVSQVHLESVRMAIDAGVHIALGTDSGVGPHGRNLEELVLLQECGMTANQALAAGTSSAAALCGLNDLVGRVAPGLVADLVVVDGGVDELATLPGRIRQVWQGGRLSVDQTPR
ncbi:metal-dependent hydrolase family protein [Leekyejoonella antrihumi]|uniref:Amidohydrolase family protein n=1 Tax=Leekyejoonella antrihumi TaxID=1660198 RepID=A0A563E7W5_9MICO|nr:amidohydrolase family protein [Leekyejoonella antrihumi]TWP38535.1 amidohydrolase family protein [Leekyejoonella antrihumi]